LPIVVLLKGLGDVEWGKFVSALKDINYDSYACIEVEDRAFEDSSQSILKSLILSKKYMSQYVIQGFQNINIAIF
jgi:sugar phosphate isomerase/epimerase